MNGSMDGCSMLTDTALPLHDHTARTENAVLQKKVKELTAELKLLRVENQSLKAEVEIYRKESALPSFSKMALGKTDSADMDVDEPVDEFVRSGDGVRDSTQVETKHEPAVPVCAID